MKHPIKSKASLHGMFLAEPDALTRRPRTQEQLWQHDLGAGIFSPFPTGGQCAIDPPARSIYLTCGIAAGSAISRPAVFDLRGAA